MRVELVKEGKHEKIKIRGGLKYSVYRSNKKSERKNFIFDISGI